MKHNVLAVFSFELDSDADSLSDFQFDACNFIQEHIMDDEDTNPIKILKLEPFRNETGNS